MSRVRTIFTGISRLPRFNGVGGVRVNVTGHGLFVRHQHQLTTPDHPLAYPETEYNARLMDECVTRIKMN